MEKLNNQGGFNVNTGRVYFISPAMATSGNMTNDNIYAIFLIFTCLKIIMTELLHNGVLSYFGPKVKLIP